MLKITWQGRRTLLGVSLITSYWSKNQNLHRRFFLSPRSLPVTLKTVHFCQFEPTAFNIVVKFKRLMDIINPSKLDGSN